MSSRGHRLTTFVYRRAKEKTLAKKAAANEKKVINFQAEGNADGFSVAERGAEVDEDGDEPGLEADDVDLECDGDGINANGLSISEINGVAGPHSASPPSVPPHLVANASSESLGMMGRSNSNDLQRSSKSASPQSTPPEMTPTSRCPNP